MPLDGVWQALCAIPTSVGLVFAFALFLLWLVEDARPGSIGEWWERATSYAVARFDALMPDTERRPWR
jgi:hypothetical protein